jgi:catalase (peroxidase I)
VFQHRVIDKIRGLNGPTADLPPKKVWDNNIPTSVVSLLEVSKSL